MFLSAGMMSGSVSWIFPVRAITAGLVVALFTAFLSSVSDVIEIKEEEIKDI
jgi:hypothetical protein